MRPAFRNILQLSVTAMAVFFLALTSPARAETMTMEQMQAQLESLTQQVDKLTAIVEAQSKLLQQQEEKVAAQNDVIAQKMAHIEPAAGQAEDTVKITMNPTPRFESADGKYSFQPMGRVHLDVTHFEDDDRDHPDNAHFRRARIGFRGDLGEDLNYKAEIDFGGEAVNIKETYLAYTGLGFADLWLGNFKPPVGLEQNTSTNYMEFVELAPVSSAFTRDEIIGAALKGGGENWSLAGGVFNEDPGSNNSNDDEGWSFDARGSADLLHDSPHVLHLGAGGSFRAPNAVNESVTLAARPAGTGNNMVSTGAIGDVDRATVLGAELAAVFGPFSAQAEYMTYAVSRDSGSDPDFDGWYAQAGYFLTGESRPYKGKTGNFDRVKPKAPFSLAEGGIGAWEILARLDNLDLNDADEGVLGGEMENMTLGVNWYLRDNVRVMLNYVDVDTDGNAVVADDDPEVITLRTQWDF